MKMKQYSLMSLSIALLGLTLLTGCPPKPVVDPSVQVFIGNDPARPTVAGPSPFDFGQAGNTVYHTFTLGNKGTTPATVGDVSDAAFKLAAPFALATPTTGTHCAKGTILAPNTSCTFAVSFTPTLAGQAKGKISVPYSVGGKAYTASEDILGSGVLNSPLLLISSDPANPTSVGLPPFDFGTVKIATTSSHQFIVINNGTQPTSISDVSAAAFQLAAPFSLAAPSAASDCTSGITLAANATCTFTVNYFPEDAILSNGKVIISYSNGATPASTMNASSSVMGTGILDCSVPAMLASYQQGTDAAQAQMGQDAIKGTLDGEALTRLNGIQDGYNISYQDAYNSGYNGPQGYPAGYAAGYAAAASGSSLSCMNGHNDGYRDGSGRGDSDGHKDGYDDGYSDGYTVGSSQGTGVGYSDGYQDGLDRGGNSGTSDGYSSGYNNCYNSAYSSSYDVGYSDGESSYTCPDMLTAASKTFFSSLIKGKSAYTKGLDDSKQLCYKQGYDATYSTSAYWNAFNAAKANNAEYQAGIIEGKTLGRIAGNADGIRDGYDYGYSVGTVDGARDIYTACYNQSYSTGYRDGYDRGYASGYPEGYSSGQTDGYNSSYNTGYNAGESDGYNDGYNANYSGAYSTGCNSGEADGDSEGYSAGYDDGYSDAADNCPDSVTAVAKSAAPKLVAPFKPTVRAVNTKAMIRADNKENLLKAIKGEITVPHGKRYKAPSAPAGKVSYGLNQPWLKVDTTSSSSQKLSAERFAGSRLPKILDQIIGKSKGSEARTMIGTWRNTLKQTHAKKATRAIKSSRVVPAAAPAATVPAKK
ncbi:MAG: choice-of-anchor D domain-containing protein [Oligoflexia bacterium]|nr:choice-of-anchor D domain-containing protein [Oligoflexia bacterium]